MICSYDPETAVDLGGMIKVPSCVVEYVVDLKDGAPAKITQWLRDRGVMEPIYRSHITSGDFGYAMVGRYGCAQVGDYGVAIAGASGTAEAGEIGVALAGNCGIATVGLEGIVIVGEYGKAIGENSLLAVVNYGGTAISGPNGHAIAGVEGKAQAGPNGKIQIEWVRKDGGMATSVGYIGEDGLEPNTLYKIEGEGTFVKVEPK